MTSTLFIPKNLKKQVIADLYFIIEAKPYTNYTLVCDYLDSNTKLKHIAIERYGNLDETKWCEQYHALICSLLKCSPKRVK